MIGLLLHIGTKSASYINFFVHFFMKNQLLIIRRHLKKYAVIMPYLATLFHNKSRFLHIRNRIRFYI